MRTTIIRIIGALIEVIFCYQAAQLKTETRLIIGLAIAIPALILLLISRKQLGKSFAVMPKAKALVTTGIYSKIQHPLYVFVDLVFIGIIIIAGLPILLIIWCILVTAQFIQSNREQKVLSGAFGSDYSNYVSKTWF